MSHETESLTNLELLEVFLKTQGSAPGTRGAILCDNASKQLLRRINQPPSQPSCLAGATTLGSPSPARSASCSASSLSRSMETGPGLEPTSLSPTQPVPPYPYILLSLLQEYLRPGVAISTENLREMESALEEALSYSTDRADILQFLRNRGYGKYVQEK